MVLIGVWVIFVRVFRSVVFFDLDDFVIIKYLFVLREKDM